MLANDFILSPSLSLCLWELSQSIDKGLHHLNVQSSTCHREVKWNFFRSCIYNFSFQSYGGCDYHSHKERKDSLEGSLDWVLFAAELEFRKILVPRLSQNSSNGGIECAGKSKQLYFLCDQLLGALIYLNFIILILICF